jgi:tRNA-dihydrouridine synthase
LCVAPMLDWTDRHCRFLHRRMAPHARLYSEMVVAQAVLHGDRERLLGFDPSERPLAVQLGGSDPELLARAARIATEWGYDEINLNVGCPSDRVQHGRFGACLMRVPELVADCVAAMQAAVPVPVTVKCRLGVDDMDDEASFLAFIDTVAERGGARVFIVHARKAWLNGLSPKENREIPPLNHARVLRLKRERPDLTVVLNGGLSSILDCRALLHEVDGVMLGRAAYHDPWLLAELDAALFGGTPPAFDTLLAELGAYAARRRAAGDPMRSITRAALPLAQGRRGAKRWRQILAAGGDYAAASQALEDAARAA